MITLQPFSIFEYIGFVIVLFFLFVMDAFITNIVARAAGREYHRVESVPWVRWIYFKSKKFSFALMLHFLFNILLFVLIFMVPMKGGYILLFVGIFLLRVWYMGYKAYIYVRGFL
jgi:hypothetical protein